MGSLSVWNTQHPKEPSEPPDEARKLNTKIMLVNHWKRKQSIKTKHIRIKNGRMKLKRQYHRYAIRMRLKQKCMFSKALSKYSMSIAERVVAVQSVTGFALQLLENALQSHVPVINRPAQENDLLSTQLISSACSYPSCNMSNHMLNLIKFGRKASSCSFQSQVH